jgi:DHA3 family tetracycline resistance protein-like MFS transporter
MFANTRRFSAYAIYLTLSFVYGLAATTIFTTNLLYQLDVAKLNALQLVLAGTVLEGTCFLCQVPTGVLADLYSRRLAMIVGIVLIGLGFLLEGSIPTFGAIAGAMVLYGLGATFTSGAEEAWVAGELGEERAGHAFLRGSQVGQAGNILGALLSVTLASLRLNIPVLVGGGLLVLLGLGLLVCMPEQGFRPTATSTRQSWSDFAETFQQGWKIAYTSPILLIILAVSLLYGLASEGYDRLTIAHLQNDIHLPPLGNLQPVVWLGLITIVSEVLGIVGTELLQRYLDVSKQRLLIRALMLLNTLGLLAMLLLAWASNLALAIAAIWIVDLFRGLKSPLYTTWLTQNTEPARRATLISLDGQMDALGQIAGGPPTGYLGLVYSLRVALTAVGLLLAPALLLYGIALRHLRRQTGQTSREQAGDLVP